MTSSTRNQPQNHHHPNPYGTTAAPPPTPSTQPHPHSTSDAAADDLSRLLQRLPPSLSIPNRRSSPPSTTTTSPPLVSLSDPSRTLTASILSASQLGYFQLTNHSISPQLARSAESESLSLFNLPPDQRETSFPKNWPLGFDGEDTEDESFCLDLSCSTDSAELSLTSLREFTCEMEKVGLEVIEALSCAVGFENPARKDPTRVCSLMWISDGPPGNKPVFLGKFYPYVVGLQYQISCQKYSMLADSGWVSVLPQVDSVLVTLGDIAQVWSNGNLKKVRGRATPVLGDGNNSPHCISMSVLLTLPLDSTVSSLLPRGAAGDGEEDGVNEAQDGGAGKKKERRFHSFPFEDYAWRVYHERLLLKDPLDRYRAPET
ncbi:hypothetical protein RJ639_001148 [Escallonia herrerae]|uniref:Isopenicillin N synthase-like Fe(2+) 2OG dioxygenase domain-containing protein n=1 Tax=Escallonia herrerae TaxID=1293975 RepID=A0AA88XQU7_9ASTE|nr:hypothetical protein RJ639_001148 [Escallonia herrerae]